MIANSSNRTFSPQRRVMPISQPRVPQNHSQQVQFLYGNQSARPLAKPGTAFLQAPRQGVAPHNKSSFLTYPAQFSQQQIPGYSLGLKQIVQGPTVKWPSTRRSFLGSVLTGEPLGLSLSTDPDFASKGFGILAQREATSVYCPVCEKSYQSSSAASLQEHILHHRQLDEQQANQFIEQSKITHRRTAILSQQGLSDQTLKTPLIVEPEEFVIEDKTPAINNLFVVNAVAAVEEERQPVRNIENTPLQYPIERANGFSCLDGWVNRDDGWGCGDLCRRNEVVARPRQLTEWEIEKKSQRLS